MKNCFIREVLFIYFYSKKKKLVGVQFEPASLSCLSATHLQYRCGLTLQLQAFDEIDASGWVVSTFVVVSFHMINHH